MKKRNKWLKSQKKFLKQVRRERKLERRRSGWYIYFFDVVHNAKRKNILERDIPQFSKILYRPNQKLPRPSFSENIKLLGRRPDSFFRQTPTLPADGVFQVPIIFSLIEKPEESFLFLKQLFLALHTDRYKVIKIDYGKCQRIDVDASVCMDVLLMDFIQYYETCARRKHPTLLDQIVPVNYEKDDIIKILTSIGAFKNTGMLESQYEDVLPFHLIIGNNRSAYRGQEKEREVTRIVDYIIECLTRMNRNTTLSAQAADDLSTVIGEVLINAAEHSGSSERYAIGYFKELKVQDDHSGVFNLVIFDFGHTIYENFTKPESRDLPVVARMKELSEKYTKSGFFRDGEFEEETLWTLYSLQEGVTSVKANRGNGSIHFIERFFRLKGDPNSDNLSFLAILSGNTKILFDGTYQIKEMPRGSAGHLYKMMTFNDSGQIEEKPDKKYVSFVENFFPGTMIVAKIVINDFNLKKEDSHA